MSKPTLYTLIIICVLENCAKKSKIFNHLCLLTCLTSDQLGVLCDKIFKKPYQRSQSQIQTKGKKNYVVKLHSLCWVLRKGAHHQNLPLYNYIKPMTICVSLGRTKLQVTRFWANLVFHWNSIFYLHGSNRVTWK